MGLLDDAIREHLELKRRRGADSSEVARQEREAFGPPTRGGLDEPAAVAAYDVHDDPADALVHESPTTLHVVGAEPPVQTEPPRPHGDPADDLPSAPSVEEHPVVEHRIEPAAAPVQPTREFDAQELRAATQPPPAPSPPAAEPEPAAAAPEPVGGHEDAPEPAAAGAARPAEDAAPDAEADVLEETPEFLQETPEHDRLWFEQRPPRDFDF